MGLSTQGRSALSTWKEANRVKHKGQDDEIGIVSLIYLRVF